MLAGVNGNASNSRAPDYDGGGIVNLVASLVAALGGRPDYPTLAALPPEIIARHRRVVLLVIDGLGYRFLAARPNSFLHRRLRARLTSVFPSTTASAITTLVTGLAPQQHGLAGWFTYLRELGSVAAVLPFRPRHGGAPYSRSGIDPRAVFDWTPVFDRLPAECHVVSAEHIADSDYSRITAGGAQRHAYRSLTELLELLARLGGEGTAPRYVYAYWPQLDSLAHEHGAGSAATAGHFAELDAGIAALAERLAGRDTLLLVCADHGLIDTGAERTVHLDDHPALAAMLRLPLCGEPRTAYAYLRPGAERALADYCAGPLRGRAVLHDSRALLEAGYFGRGPVHPRFAERLGDAVLLMEENWIIKDSVLGERPFTQIGVHGGLSPEELYVPLVAIGDVD